jgi:hypothetical protein
MELLVYRAIIYKEKEADYIIFNELNVYVIILYVFNIFVNYVLYKTTRGN